MKKLTLLYGKLSKKKSASMGTFDCETSYSQKWGSEKESQKSRLKSSPDFTDFDQKNQCMSEQLPRSKISEKSRRYVEEPRGVFIGAEERIPTLKKLPWKSATLSSDSEDEEVQLQNDKSSTKFNRPEHSRVNQLKIGYSKVPLQRTLSSPE